MKFLIGIVSALTLSGCGSLFGGVLHSTAPSRDYGPNVDIADLVSDLGRYSSFGNLGVAANSATYSVVSDGGACFKLAKNSLKIGECKHGFHLFMNGKFIAAHSGANGELWALDGTIIKTGCHVIRCSLPSVVFPTDSAGKSVTIAPEPVSNSTPSAFSCTCQTGGSIEPFVAKYNP